MARVDPSKLPFALGGLPSDTFDYDHWIQRVAEGEAWIRKRAPDDDNVSGDLSSICHQSHLAAISMYVLGEQKLAREWAQRILDSVDTYFFGGWRDQVRSGNFHDQPPNREFWDKFAVWQDEFKASIVWGSALGAWDRLERITGYLRDDVELDFEQSKENRAWLLLVAGVIRGRDRAELRAFADTVMNGKKVRERQLLMVLDAILEQAPEQASSLLEQYAKRYLKVELPENDMTKKIAVDATFLVHWAEYSDVELEVPEKLRPHLVVF